MKNVYLVAEFGDNDYTSPLIDAGRVLAEDLRVHSKNRAARMGFPSYVAFDYLLQLNKQETKDLQTYLENLFWLKTLERHFWKVYLYDTPEESTQRYRDYCRFTNFDISDNFDFYHQNEKSSNGSNLFICMTTGIVDSF